MAYNTEVAADGPIAWYRLGDTSGTTMTDSSGNARNGTLSGTPTLNVASLTNDAANKATTLNGSSQYGTVPSAAWMNLTSFTLEGVIRPTSVSGNRTIVTRRSSTTVNDTTIAWVLRTNSNRAEVFLRTTGVSTTLSSGATLAINTTYHIAATYNSVTGLLMLFVNGGFEGATTITPATIGGSAVDLSIGRHQGGAEFFAGTLDEVAIYNTDLSAARIYAHAKETLASTSTARVSREHVEVLNTTSPDARVTREHVEVVHAVNPTARVTREHVEVLHEANPDIRISARRQEVMIDPPVPDMRLASQRVEVLYGTAVQRITVNKAYEVDTATQIAYPQVKAVGQATEVDIARPLTQFIPVGQATEVDEAQALHVAFHQSFEIGQASETDAAQQLTRVARRTLGQAEETDTAGAMTLAVGQTVVMGQASETDAALAIAFYGILNFNVSVAVELDEARQLTSFVKHLVPTATETDRALPAYIEWVTNPSGEVLL